MQSSFEQLLTSLAQPNAQLGLQKFKRGVERECLRITPTGNLAATGHPKALGSALKHEFITTDYSESLLEFITPVATDINVTLMQLSDIHKFTYQQLGDELLWPLSMPCFVGDAADIKIAQYGSSHAGMMKTLYREGLTWRYGGAMQIISGVHYNFSIADELWQALAKADGVELNQAYRSKRYFDLIRNYKRISWVIPYLFGASPAICQSFIKHAEDNIEFEKLGKGTVYRKYGTSLRMSDLGYTNKEQAALAISYNSLTDYVTGLRRAITMPSENFKEIGVKVDGSYRQLNSNVLQIENEFYAPIRPKRVANPGETPTQALERGGVQYIEVRALDVNPFSPVGITADQMRLLDTLLMTCLLLPSPELSQAEQKITDSNFNRVVLDGRNPRLSLNDSGYERSIADWLEDLFSQFHQVARYIDQANQSRNYEDTIAEQYKAVLNPELTLSGQFMTILREQNLDNSELGMRLAQHYKNDMTSPLQFYTEAQFKTWAEQSLAAQVAVEEKDHGHSFDEFLQAYFTHAAESVEYQGDEAE